MRFDKTTVILDIDDVTPIENKSREGVVDSKDPILTFGYLAILALTSEAPNPDTKQARSDPVKIKDAKLASRIKKAQQFFDCTAEEAAWIGRMCGMFSPTIVWRLSEIIDNPLPQPEKSSKQKAPPAGRQSDPPAPGQP